jgi:chromosome segregation and condensation protein ScpB
VTDTLLARGLIADDAGFGGRGRPAFLVTTDRFLHAMGVGSLTELPVRPALRWRQTMQAAVGIRLHSALPFQSVL